MIVGLDRAPDHAVILYPSRCTRSIQILFVEDDRLPELQEELAARAQEDRRDYQELREGEPFRFLRGDNYCPDSAIVAIPRGALLRRFKAATPKERRRLVDDEPAVLRSTLELPEVRPVVPKRSRLKSVRETLRIAGLTADALVVGVDAHDYTFRDGTTQRLAIGASARPELPQRPIADEVLAAADAGAVGWEARVLQDRSEKTGSMDGRESGDEAATAPPEIDATAGSKDGGTPSAIAAGASDEGDPSAIAAGASDEAATSAGSATSAAASSDASSDEAAPATAGTPTSGTTSAVQSRPPATSAEVDDASVEEDAEEDEDTDDEPPGRRLRLWITALLAGLVSLGSLWWIRRDRR